MFAYSLFMKKRAILPTTIFIFYTLLIQSNKQNWIEVDVV